MGTFFIGLVFRLLYSVATGISEAADEKADFRLSEGKARKPLSANLRADVSHVFKFSDRAMPGGGDSGDDVLRFHDDSAVTFAILVGVLIAFTALIPIFGAFIGCVVGAFLILTVSPLAGSGIYRAVPLCCSRLKEI